MSNHFAIKMTTVLVSSLLAVGSVVSVPAMSPITAEAKSKSISYHTFKGDLSALKSAVKYGSPQMKAKINSAFIVKMTKDPLNSYYSSSKPSFGVAMQAMAKIANSHFNSDDRLTSQSKADLVAINSLYKHFSGRFSVSHRNQLNEIYKDFQKTQASGDKSIRSQSKIELHNFASIFGSDMGSNVAVDHFTGFPGTTVKKPVKTSKATRLTVGTTKLTNEKYVKVTGQIKNVKSAQKAANYARIQTNKGSSYAKLNSKHAFSKTVYAPKVKTIKVTIGHYSKGHFKVVMQTMSVPV